MRSILEEYLGHCISAREVADYLQCDITTVYRNYKILGGLKMGKCYKFFEKGLVESILQQKIPDVGLEKAVWKPSSKKAQPVPKPSKKPIRRTKEKVIPEEVISKFYREEQENLLKNNTHNLW